MNETSTAITTRYADIGVNLLCFHVFISRVGYLESVQMPLLAYKPRRQNQKGSRQAYIILSYSTSQEQVHKISQRETSPQLLVFLMGKYTSGTLLYSIRRLGCTSITLILISNILSYFWKLQSLSSAREIQKSNATGSLVVIQSQLKTIGQGLSPRYCVRTQLSQFRASIALYFSKF